MNNPARVGRRQRLGYLNGNSQGTLQFKRPPIDELTHIAPFNVLHRDEMQAIRLVEIEYGADVRMIQRRSQSGFAFESFQVCFLASKFRGKDLDYDSPAQLIIDGLINGAL